MPLIAKGLAVNSGMKEAGLDLRQSVQAYGIQKEIVDILFLVFPNDSFKEHSGLFKEAINQPSSMGTLIHKLEMQLGLGVTSHVAIAARELLSLQNFPMFTRDYVRRCCNLVEHTMKFLLLPKLRINARRKSLGALVKILRDPRYHQIVPRGLINNLDLFDEFIYRPAKHEVLENAEKHMFSVSDAITITFISIKLCHEIQNFYHAQR